MAKKKGIVATAVRAAVTAAEKAIAPSPFAKKVIAAAAAEAVRQVERRAPDMLAPVEKKLRKNAGEMAKPIDKALAEKKQPQRRSQKSSRRGGAPAASRTKTKSSRARAGAARKKTVGASDKNKSKKSKRR